jgi:hypothetical protein
MTCTIRTTVKYVVSTIAVTAVIAGLGLSCPAGSASGTKHPSPWTPTASNAAINARLHALEGTQSPAQIKAVLSSGQPVQGLFDSTSGTVVAAYVSNPLAAITHR